MATLSRAGRRLVLAMIATLLALGGCSDSSRSASPAPAPRPFAPEDPGSPSSPETWLGQVCTALVPAVRSGPAPAVVPTDAAGTRDRWVSFLGERQQALAAAADGINAAGPAPVPGGQQVTEPVVTVLRDRASAARDAVGELTAVPADAEATLLQTVQEVQSRFPLTGPAPSLNDLALTPELSRVAATVPTCQAAGRA
jgi:hypothetical protein